jgi:CheY-like chemotaxis protein
VRDTGIGISADHMQSLFRPFEQVGDLERRASGTGLGLAISRKLVRLMGGDIHVTSQAEAGSTFWFELDMLPTAQPARTRGTHGVMIGYRGRRRVVLVVDDVAESRAVLADMLTPLGFAVVEAASGRQALSMAQERRPDLVITDLAMPGMNGRELVRCLRETADFSRAPIIVASASPMARPEREDCAADAFLTKPLDAREVLLRIGALLAIEWIYETPEGQPAHNLGELIVPPLHELQLLHSLAREDKMQQIVQWSERVGHNPRYHRFTRQVATLANQYETPALLSFVERHLDSTV